MDLFSAPNWYDQLLLLGTHLFVPGPEERKEEGTSTNIGNPSSVAR